MTLAQIHNAVGLRTIAMIEENIKNGVSYKGTQFEYSSRPFARPVGTFKGLQKWTKSEHITPFTAKNGALWMVINGGYKSFREMQGLSSTSDFLQVSGAMLRNLQVLSATKDIVKIGFTSSKQAQKALWLNATGVGRSRRLWPFLGLSKEQQEELAEYGAGLIAQSQIKDILMLPNITAR